MEQNSIFCPQCQTQIASGLLSCPSCHALVHSQEIKNLAAQAEQNSKNGELAESLIKWRKVLTLLPENSEQYKLVAVKISDLGKKVDSKALKKAEAKEQKISPVFLSFGVLGILAWKFKFLIVLIFTKLKFLLLGLTKAKTFFSMLLAFGVYWSVWGWPFALGVIISIYIHEMGHVYMMKKFGMPIDAPMFIPGFGAFIQLKQAPVTPTEDARIGLAGPIAGLGAALFCYAVFLATGWHIWGAIAQIGAWINLFNLIPFSPLDGGRGFHALSREQKGVVLTTMIVMWFVTKEALLIILAAVALFHTFKKSTDTQSDTRAMIEYILLVVILSLMCKIPVQTH